MKDVTKIVLTGGPCAGKTTALSRIEQFFTAMGYRVIFLAETATELITGGIDPRKMQNLDFQIALMTLQLSREKVYEQAAHKLPEDKVLIVCDRGALDNKAYMTEEEFIELLSALDANEVDLRDNYDAVFHMVTAADGAEKFYTTENNQARTETPEQAIAMDRALVSSWTGHPHLRIIDNSTDFTEKLNRVIREISHCLGEPVYYEIERKFLIEYPDIKKLESIPDCRNVDIIQTYLVSSDPESEIRIRQRGYDGNYIYTKTEKRKVSDGTASAAKRVEVENRLSRSEYLTLMMDADTNLRQIRKTRYCLVHDTQYLEIDIYPFWKNQAILEIELTDENAPISIPDFIKVIREVTEEEVYKNYSIAKDIPKE